MTRESPTHVGAFSSEVDYLIPSTVRTSRQSTEQPSTSHQSAYSRYGALGVAASHDGINIVKQTTAAKEYSPQFGAAPKTGGTFFSIQQSSNASTPSRRNDKSPLSENTSSNSGSKSTSGSGHGDTFTGLTAGGVGSADGAAAGPSGLGKMRKSDSTASDWVSTPTDEMIGIDVNGPEESNLITFPRE